MAIARRVGFGRKIIVGDKNIENSYNAVRVMTEVGFDIEAFECDISSRESILSLIQKGQELGEISMLKFCWSFSLSSID